MSFKDDLLSLHLIKKLMSLDCIRQRHDFVEHESGLVSNPSIFNICKKLTQGDLAFAREALKLLEKSIERDICPSVFSGFCRTLGYQSTESVISQADVFNIQEPC